MTLRPALLALTALALPLVACGDDTPSSTDATDTVTADTVTPDDTAPVADTAVADTAAPEDTTPADVVDNTWGFPIRYPQKHTFACPDVGIPIPDLDALEADWLCTFTYDGASAALYVQADPTSCEVSMSGMPVFGASRGWIAVDGAAPASVSETGYDWGGNHHNDSLTFTWNGKGFTVYHSSLGFGWRACQDMDCFQVRDAAGTLLEDGCTMERTLPAVCRQVLEDGTWAELTDTFAPCAGDPNYR